jgi:diguanylate cyclase (GGDEF)-like protein
MEQQLKEARANEQSAKTDSLHDALTGLLNRRGFNTDATMALLSDQREGQETALLFCDLDHFKLWNDQLGHIGGDEVLKSVASVLPSHTRLGDVLCRWGGEELAVVLRNTGQAEARAIAERIRVSVANLEVTIRRPAGGKLIRLNSDGWPGCTISIGIAVAPEHGTELADLCELADQALRQAKDSGRNQVVLAAPAAGRAPAWSDTPVG